MFEKFKYKKVFKKKIKNSKFNLLLKYFMGIRVLESCRLTLKQVETIRRVFVRVTKREGKFFIRVQANQILTKKSKSSRMGKGVGSFDSAIIDIKPGQIIFEFTFIDLKLVTLFLAGIKGKIPAKIELVLRESFNNVNKII
jgi:large subunit ribosomal protein L16